MSFEEEDWANLAFYAIVRKGTSGRRDTSFKSLR
jgi:hypothetical protein